MNASIDPYTNWFDDKGQPIVGAGNILQDIINAISGIPHEDFDPIVVEMSPRASPALMFTNVYGLTVKTCLQFSYPNLRCVTKKDATLRVWVDVPARGAAINALNQELDGLMVGLESMKEHIRHIRRKAELIAEVTAWR